MDDFYLTSEKLAIVETTLYIYGDEILDNIRTRDAVMEPIRVMVANRLATTGTEWASLFSKHNRYKSFVFFVTSV